MMTRATRLLGGLLLAGIVILGTMTVVYNREQPAENDHAAGKQIVHALSQERSLVPRGQIFFEASRRRININIYDIAKPDVQQAIVEQTRSLSVIQQYDGTVIVSFFPARKLVKRDLPNGVSESEVLPSKPLIVVTVK